MRVLLDDERVATLVTDGMKRFSFCNYVDFITDWPQKLMIIFSEAERKGAEE